MAGRASAPEWAEHFVEPAAPVRIAGGVFAHHEQRAAAPDEFMDAIELPALPGLVGEQEHQCIRIGKIALRQIGRDRTPGAEALNQNREHPVHAAGKPAIRAMRGLEPVEIALLVKDDLPAGGAERLGMKRRCHGHEDRR